MEMDADDIRRVSASGQVFAAGMRTRGGGQPSSQDLGIWQSAAAGCVAYLRLLDAAVVAAYEANLDESDRRLIKAMW
jgi:hypothetical protein